ncbi:MAG: TonB-dependent receptor [Gammaproteobacteria bacterium]|nr:TonB-dependent receptor [Gammaproteobacteria bacterium]
MPQSHHAVFHHHSPGQTGPGVAPLRRAMRSPLFGVAFALSLGAVGQPVAAQPAAEDQARRSYDIPAGPLGAVLSRFAGEAGVVLSFDATLLSGKNSPGLQGVYGAEEGLAALLQGSGYAASRNGAGYVLTPEPEDALLLPAVNVEGVEDARFGDAPREPGGLKAEYQTTATKSALPLRETPQSISVITRDSIEARQSLDLSSALELSAGVIAGSKTFAGNSPRSGEGFTLRGQELDSGRDIRIDGFAAGGEHNNFDLAPFERVEAVKGPSSMLYGQGSLGGFINMVTKKPQAEPMLKVAAQAGSFDTFRVEADTAGALDADERVRGQAAVAYEDSGSFIDGVESRRAVLAPSLEWLIDDRTRVLAQLIYQDDKFIPSLGIALRQEGNKLVPPDVPRSFFFGVPSTEDSTASGLHMTVKVDRELSDRWLATLQLHRSRNRLMGISDSYGYGIDDAGNTYLYASWVGQEDVTWAGELRLDGRFEAFGREHRLLAGVERNRGDFLAWGGYTSSIGTANIYDGSLATAASIPARSLPRAYDGRVDSSNEAIYGQVLLSVLDRTKLLLGIRYDRAKLESVFNGLSATPGDTMDKKEPTVRIGVVQDLNESLTGYAVYAQSFNPVLDLSQNGILDPETGEGFELGLKGEWFDGQLGATVAVFRQELDNRPIPDPDPDLPSTAEFFISGGLQRSDGLELEITGTPRPGWTVGAASAWLDAEYIDRQDPNFGKTPGGTVKRQSSLYTSYELQGGTFKGLGFGATLLSVGDRIVLTDENLFVDGYERLDLHAFYKGLPGWDFSLLVRNVTDEKYIERPNSAFLYSHFFGAPRSVLLRADYNFDL